MNVAPRWRILIMYLHDKNWQTDRIRAHDIGGHLWHEMNLLLLNLILVLFQMN